MKTATKRRPSGTLRLSFSVIVEPDEGGFYARCPAFKGIHVDGKTEEEAVHRAIEAAKCYIESMVRHNEALPVNPDLIVAREARRQVHARHFEVQWPSLQVCGVS